MQELYRRPGLSEKISIQEYIFLPNTQSPLLYHHIYVHRIQGIKSVTVTTTLLQIKRKYQIIRIICSSYNITYIYHQTAFSITFINRNLYILYSWLVHYTCILTSCTIAEQTDCENDSRKQRNIIYSQKSGRIALSPFLYSKSIGLPAQYRLLRCTYRSFLLYGQVFTSKAQASS